MTYLLDTNFIIRLYEQHADALEIIANQRINFEDCRISVITYLEVLGYSGNTREDIEALNTLLSYFNRIGLTAAIQQQTITLRQAHKIKLPDGIIIATALVHDLHLVTFDMKATKVFEQYSY